MSASRITRRMLLALAVSLPVAAVSAQPAATEFKPEVGQQGKDVVWVPTPQALVDKMLDMAKVTQRDFVMDLGSGDGRTVITAAKRGAQAVGIEYNPDMVELSRRNAEQAGVADKAKFMKADLFETDLSKATVITMFLLPEINLKLRPKILGLKPGTRVVSNSFTMGEWEADETANVTEGCTSYCTALFWIVPAKADGTWQLGNGTLTLNQDFQMLSGTLKSGGTETRVTGRMRGDRISFNAGKARYTARVNGSSMVDGTIRGGGRDGSFTATKQ